MMILAIEADMSGLVFEIVTNWQVTRLFLQKITKNCWKMPKSQVSNSFCVKSTSGNTQITKISQLSISKVYKVLPDVKKNW